MSEEATKAALDRAVQQQAAFIGCLEELSNWPDLAKVQYGVQLVDPRTMETRPLAIEASKVIGIMDGIHRHATEMLGFGKRAVEALREVEDVRIQMDVAKAETKILKAKLAAIEPWLAAIDENWGGVDAQQGFETDRIRAIIAATCPEELAAVPAPPPVASDDDGS